MLLDQLEILQTRLLQKHWLQILMFQIKGRRVGKQLDLVFILKVIISMTVVNSTVMCLLEGNNYKGKEDVLFALKLVIFQKSVQLILSPVIIVKWLDIIEVFVQQNLQYQRKVVWKGMLTKLMLT